VSRLSTLDPEVLLLSFPPFQLNLREERLLKAGTDLRLRRKPFAILRYLVEHPRRLVTQEELVDAVWGKVAMSDSVLRTHVRALRQVIGEGLIETVVGRGYRFVVDVQEEADSSLQPCATVADAPMFDTPQPYFVGRVAELSALRDALQSARNGLRRLVFVTGETGAGKTALVDALLQHAASEGAVWRGRGVCVEQYGSGEAYLPVFAALGRLCRNPGGERVVDVLSRHAPTWLAQMPAFVTAERGEELQRRIAGATRARMLRELVEALEALSADRPVVLALGDLQWSDPSTAELILMLGRRREAARLLVVGTYRPAELAKTHPLTRVLGELIVHNQATELQLARFSEETVAEYVDKRFAGHRFPRELVRTVHETAGGNPLVVVTLFDDLEARQMVRVIDERWQLATTLEDVASRRPDSIRRLVDLQIDRLSVTEQRVLEAASVAGHTFAAGTVAHALDMPVDDIESCCDALSSQQRFVRFLGTETWPDGTIQSCYGFAHAFYKHAALTRSTSVRQWHRRIAERLEAGHGDDADSIAPELAVHFDEGHAFSRAAHYYALAGERARRRHGAYEALGHFERARALIARLPERHERDELELQVLHGLGPCLFATKAFSAEEFVPIFERAAGLASRLAKDEHLCAALNGLQRCRLMKGELRQVGDHADDLARLVSRLPDPALGDPGAFLAPFVSLHRGHLAEAERGLTLLCANMDARGGEPTEVAAWARTALTFVTWLTGYPDKAVEWGRAAVSTAEAVGDPFALAFALYGMGITNAWRGDMDQALAFGQRALAIATEGHTVLWQHWARLLIGWASSELDPTTSAARVEEILAQPGDSTPRSLYALPFVELSVRAGREALALETISAAMDFMRQADDRGGEPELHRLRGELLKATDKHEAGRCFMKAIEVASLQSSKSFELRAAMSLYRLLSGAKKRKALEDVRRVFETFTEGFETRDLLEAKAVLASE
jgi:DNA-binding winged helix-turn-helix (wHTH) protein/tetratricopeptide (TPR) repeat protein